MFRRTVKLLALVATGALLGCSSTKPAIVSENDRMPSGIDEEIVLSPRESEEPTTKMYTDFAYFFAEVGNQERSIELFRQAMKADKKNPQPYVGLAKLYMRMNHPDEAVRVLQQGAKACKRSPEIWNELGVVYGTQRNYDAAKKAMETCLKYAPERPLYIENYAGVLAAAGEYEPAYQNFARVVPPSEARFRVAGIAHSAGDSEQSLKNLELALQENPGHRASLAMMKRISGEEINQVGYVVEESENGLESTHRR